MRSIQQQSGMSLVELMISMALGIFVIGGVFTVYVAVSKSSAETLKQSRLNAEMSALMNIMANDIRRAGYWEINTDGSVDASGKATFSQAEIDAYVPQDNPFSDWDEVAGTPTTALNVWDQATTTSQLPTGSGDCILYTYDADRDGVLDTDEGYGFRLNGSGIDMRQTGNASTDCTVSGEWAGIVDTAFILITSLSFDLSNSQCINAAEPNETDDGGTAGTVDDDFERNCYDTGTATTWAAASTGDSTTEIREVLISLSAQLANDSQVSLSTEQTVRVRNDLVRVR